MSFYDNIQIALAQLPLSEPERQLFVGSWASFQTQSLEGMYAVYTIMDDGCLERGGTRWKDDENKRTPTVRIVDAHGVIEFYDKVGDEWFYFKARFREGRVTHLLRLEEMPETYSRTCTWELELPVNELKSAYDAEAIRRELSLLDARERQHLEDEFADFDQRFPRE